MANHVKRMLSEYEDLDRKITELDNFINSDKLTDVLNKKGMESVDLLVLQLDAMSHYRMILKMRLYLEGIQDPVGYIQENNIQ